MIFVECKPDFVLVNQFISRREIVHAGNISEVIKKVLKQAHSIGVIDEDPSSPKPTAFRKFVLRKTLADESLQIYTAKNKSKLIVLSPNLEGWILQVTRKEGINLRKYGLPENERELHEIINLNLAKFEKLLQDLIIKKNKQLLALRSMLHNEF